MDNVEIEFLRDKVAKLQAELAKANEDYAILAEEYKELKWRMEGLEK